MIKYLLFRLGSAISILLGVSTLVFLLIHIVPGDPVEVMLGESARQSDIIELYQSLGLDQPLLQQWYRYMIGLFTLDLGMSLYSKEAVIDILLARIPATLILGGASMLVALVIAIPLGVLAAVYKDSIWDRIAMLTAVLGVSIPNFVMGPILILVFAIWLKILPVSGYSMSGLILPALTLGTALASVLSRMIRSAMLDVLQEDYICAAYAHGLSYFSILFNHALRNAALPIITVMGLQVGMVLTGAVITETIFSWPGVGQLLIESIQRRDYPLVQVCVLLISAIYVVVNFLTDCCYVLLDARIKLFT